MNISKTKRFPSHYYFVYKLNSKERGDWLNTWFEDERNGRFNKNTVRKHEKNLIGLTRYYGYMTLKKCDDNTKFNLYDRRWNPVNIFIRPHLHWNKEVKEYNYIFINKLLQYDCKAMICSVDDTSYGIWLTGRPLDELKELQLKVMKWVDQQDELNGDKFIQYCISIGFDENEVDYN